MLSAALRGLCLIGVTGGLAAGQPAVAQGADGLRPLTGAISFTGQAGTLPPPESEDISITLSGVTLEGALPAMQAANAAYESRLTGGPIPVAEIFDATADLQAAYQEAGFALTQVVLPRQSLTNGGALRAQVVRGVVEAVDIAAVPANIRAPLERLTAPLVGDPGLTRSDLERRLILAGEVPGTALDATLVPGTGLGDVVIDLAPDYRRVTGYLGYDNSLADILGNDNLTFGIELNSPFGWGEAFYARLSGAAMDLFTSDPATRTWSLGTVVPLGSSGWTLNLERTQTEGVVFADFSFFRSEYERTTLRTLYPVIRNQQVTLSGQISLDIVDERGFEDFGGGFEPWELFRDRLTVLRAGGSGSFVHADGAVTEGALTFSRGLDAFDAATPQSRFGAETEFSKVTGGLTHRRQLGEAVALSVGGRFQTSFGDTLAASELFSLVGPQEISTFPSGSLKGDAGWLARAELSRTFDLTLGQLPVPVSPYVFAAHGEARRHDFFEQDTTASSYGIGVDLFTTMDSAFRSGSLRIEYGKGMRDDLLPDENRLSVSGAVRF